MSASFTPGPWIPKEPNGHGMGWAIGLAWLGKQARSEQTAADALLIASAPDLLLELRDAVAIIESLGGNASTQRAAIAAAIGEAP